jgi:YD repeat-containing protein
MLRRNLLKSLTALIPISFIGKNTVANENPKYKWEKLIKDENENIIRKEFSDGHFIDFTYNQLGQKTSRKDSDGFWEEYTYNENGRIIFQHNSTKFWQKTTYNERGQQLTRETSTGFLIQYTYDKDGRELTCRNSDGYWSERTYDKFDGRLITFEDSKNGYHECLYNPKGQYILIEKIKPTYDSRNVSKFTDSMYL